MSLANFPSDGTVTQLQMPYMFRLSFLAIVLNKYDVWRYSKEYPLEEIGRCLMGVIKIQILQWNRGVSRSYQMLKQQLHSIEDEAGATGAEDDEGEDLIKSINSLLNKGKQRTSK